MVRCNNSTLKPFPEAAGLLPSEPGGRLEASRSAPADQRILGGAQAPGSGCNAADREAGLADDAGVDVERRSRRDERELVGRAVAHFEIARAKSM